MNAELVSIDRITVLDFVERPLSKVSDDRDRQSIQAVGIQQPLVCIAADGRLLLAKGPLVRHHSQDDNAVEHPHA